MRDSWISHAETPDADWQAIDRTITMLSKQKGAIDAEIGRWLLAAERAKVHRRCGYGSFAEYVERRLGYDPRTTREKLRVARSLESLPALGELLRSGERPWSAVRELARVTKPHTEAAWIARTERLTVHEVEAMVAGRKPGDLPTDAKDPLLEKRRVVFDLPPDSYALLMEALERARDDVGPKASNAEALAALAEIGLGHRPESRASYQTSLTVCVSCERTWEKAGGDFVEVTPALAECARCDGEIVGFAKVDEGIAELDAPESSAATKVGDRSDASATHVGHEARGAERAVTHAGLGALAELDPALGARGLVRLASKLFGVPSKTVTPRLRRAVYARDRGRCVVPGCRNFRFVEMHHHERRAWGGPNTLENLSLLCSTHHAALHDGLIAIEGTPSEGLRVLHSGGVLYGAPRAAPPE